jgi:hypothetical protein
MANPSSEILIYEYINSSLNRAYEVYFNTVTKATRVSLTIPSEEVASEPPIGYVLYSACDGLTLDRVIYNGGNRVSYSPINNSPTCNVVKPIPDVELEYTSTKSYTAVCGANYTGSYTSTQTRTSAISQTDADIKATEAAKLDAESKMVCTLALEFEDAQLNLDTSWTISYSPELKSWSSFHNYSPTLMLSKENNVLLFSNNKIETFSHDVSTCHFFGTSYENYLEVIANKEPLLTKVFDNLIIQGTIFDMISCSNSFQSSDFKRIVIGDELEYDPNEIICKYRNSQYQLPIPRTSEETRFRGKYLIVRLTKNPYGGLHLKYLTVLFRLNSR